MTKPLNWLKLTHGWLSEGLLTPFIVYPSGGKYHTVCAVHQLLLSCGDAAKRQRIRKAVEQLAKETTHTVLRDSGMADAITKLEEEVLRELRDGDPMNSEAVVKLIEQLYGDDASESASWDVPLTVF